LFEGTKTVDIISPVDLHEVANLVNIPYEELQAINPELIHEFTPFNQDKYTIRVPDTVDPAVLVDLKRLPPTKRHFTGWHEVRQGDSLYSIARKFNTTVAQLKQANKLHSNALRPGKRLLIPLHQDKPLLIPRNVLKAKG
jgi:membrane-bound lytic murein transglycosylase D